MRLFQLKVIIGIILPCQWHVERDETIEVSTTEGWTRNRVGFTLPDSIDVIRQIVILGLLKSLILSSKRACFFFQAIDLFYLAIHDHKILDIMSHLSALKIFHHFYTVIK